MSRHGHPPGRCRPDTARDSRANGSPARADDPLARQRSIVQTETRANGFELWWLLPISGTLFALGGGRAHRHSSTCCANRGRLPLSYFAANCLLNEQADKAIESFIEVVKVVRQTIDMHFALRKPFPAPG